MVLVGDVRAQGRDEVVSFLRRHLIGPVAGGDERLSDPPSYLYTAGVLFPVNADTGQVLRDERDEEGSGSGDELVDDPVSMANQLLPSSVGLSFYIRGEPLVRCDVTAGVYGGDGPAWVRSEVDATATLSDTATRSEVLGGRARLQSRWRPLGDGHLVTVALVNARTADRRNLYEPADCLFQVRLSCKVTAGFIGEYPSVDGLAVSDEEAELRLLYRHVSTYAIGHGCAAAWDPPSGQPVTRVVVEFLPMAEVPPVVQGVDESPALSIAYLAECPPGELISELTSFVERYSGWARSLRAQTADLPPRFRPAAARLADRVDEAERRMRSGVLTLEDAGARRAFQLAHRAMLMQMRHSEGDLGGRPRRLGALETEVDGLRYADPRRRWHPFQLAFILLTLDGVFDGSHPDRDLVDLLWFPTGGGKTEAYLAISAMAIIHRRMTLGARGGGTAVLTRYTLRLLTNQQFERAARLVCALEAMRADTPELGDEPVSIGLWVGEDTPNTFQKATERAGQVLQDERPENLFQFDRCPWCGTSIVPEMRSPRGHYGFTASNDAFTFNCPDGTCRFHSRLPVQVVDQGLYSSPPTVLIGTVDKFARMAWLPEPGIFLGGGAHEPPSLVIQDELHLLSGPLGTTVGLYEAAFSAVCSLNGGAPKVIAATATIRDAGAQVRAVFGMAARVFPPAGLDSRDSYFSKADTSSPGRLYVGVLAPSHTPSTSLVRTAAILAQAPLVLTLTDAEKDAYWTVVAYHNSLRELGKTVTFARDDIPAWIEVIAGGGGDQRVLTDDNVLELTSNVYSSHIPAALSRLGSRWDSSREVSFLACTNMLSVGVDVPRLGIMLVNGQPKTTSEYIQASSRVGRGAVPGVVVAHYSATKPRDRSHYESFLPYHHALYRHVEPTSVTPFSLPSRRRALHAALVIVVRHGAGLVGNDEAASFLSTMPPVVSAMEALLRRAELADPDEAEATAFDLQRLATDWEELAVRGQRERHPLHYNTKPPLLSLLTNFGSASGHWPTLNSMRNVDRVCRLDVVSERS